MNKHSEEVPEESTRKEETSVMGRRRFFTLVSAGAAALVGAILAVIPGAFALGPAFVKKPRVWRAVGPVDNYKVGETVAVSFEAAGTAPWAGVTARRAAWLRRQSESEFTAFAVNCSHLGCPVRWESDADLFLCPCHGGVYYSNGDVAGGPPPRPLSRYRVRVRNGQVEIETESVLTA